jgi:hypothetical protein
VAKVKTATAIVVSDTKKRGNAKKSYNKHSPRPKAYRGQGR